MCLLGTSHSLNRWLTTANKNTHLFENRVSYEQYIKTKIVLDTVKVYVTLYHNEKNNKTWHC